MLNVDEIDQFVVEEGYKINKLKTFVRLLGHHHNFWEFGEVLLIVINMKEMVKVL